jgi:hypothetical protein
VREEIIVTVMAAVEVPPDSAQEAGTEEIEAVLVAVMTTSRMIMCSVATVAVLAEATEVDKEAVKGTLKEMTEIDLCPHVVAKETITSTREELREEQDIRITTKTITLVKITKDVEE